MLRNLLDRRVPQFLGIYLAAGWGALEFTDYLVNRYLLSPHLGDFALLTWAAMIPTVLMLAYFHGAPGRQGWSGVEKIAIPVNVIAALALLFVTFSGKDLGAATTEITVADETGAEIERVIPKAEFRKRLALFYFDNESGDTALDWLQYGIPLGLEDDLLQDIFLDVKTSWPFFSDRLEEEGYDDGLKLPLALRRDIAEELHLAYFVSGKLSRQGDQLAVTTSLYETRRGKLLEQRKFADANFFELIDSMSVQLKRDLSVPEPHIEETTDLPVAEMLTTSSSAYRQFVEGRRALEAEEWAAASAHFRAAANEDPTYAWAHLMRFLAGLLLSDTEEMRDALETAMRYGYKLPERTQFTLKANYYLLVRQEPAKSLAVAQMHAELFPGDVAAHQMLLQLYSNSGQREKAIAAARRILELDPRDSDMLRILGALHLEMGEYEQARGYYEQYAEAFPQDPRAFNSLGDLNRNMGAYDSARDYYEQALVLDPGDVGVLIDLARTETSLGRFLEARAQYEEALDAAVTPQQRANVYDSKRWYFERRGQMDSAIAYLEAYWDELEHVAPPLSILQEKLAGLGTYVKAGRPDAAHSTLSQVADQLSPPLDLLIPWGALDIAVEEEDADGIEEALEGMETLMSGFGLEALRPLTMLADGKLLEIRGECDQAIFSYERALELLPVRVETHTDIGRCHRKLANFSEAEQRLQATLQIEPYDPLTHLEMARVYAEIGEKEKALDHLKTSLRIWEDATPGYKHVGAARALFEELNGN